MNQYDEELQSVLDEMFTAEKKFTFETVSRWQSRYPQFRSEIADAVADWREFEFLVLDDAKTLEANELSENAGNAVKKALAQFRQSTEEAITDLQELAEKRGVSREDLINSLGVSEFFMRKIDRRYVKEIPQAIENKLAEILRVSVESLRSFFALPAMLSPSMKYKSKDAPQTQQKESFAEAVGKDPEMTAEQKQALLKLE